MCGFAGVVAWDDRYRTSRETLAAMSVRIAHRGPNGQGTWINHEAEITAAHPQAALAHRRLAVIDLDPRANQPFTDGRGRWIVFNGEIYNFRELRAQRNQLSPSYPWRTECDTEVLLAAYQAWGGECVERLNGMFAFAIWDEPAQIMFLARDRMGQKPLYWTAAKDKGAIAFASELSALRALPWFDADVNELGIGDYLRLGYFPRGQTVYRSTFQLRPSRIATVRRGQMNETAYFDPNASAPPLKDGAAIEQTGRLVRQAVQRQLIADVPVGCFLSGGMDSSIVAASIPRDHPVMTFSIGFDDPRYDESEYAAQVARHLGTAHERLVVRPDASLDLPKLAAAFGEPFGDSSALPTYYLARQTRQHVTVALSGDGGDELFGGYDRYRAMALAERIPAALRPALSTRIIGRLPGSHPKSRSARLKRLLATLSKTPAERYAQLVQIFDDETASLLWPTPPACPWIRDEFEKLRNQRDVVQAALAVDRITYLPDDLLTKVDRCSMQFALEVRCPFMDHELARFAAGLNTNQLLRGGAKRMLREAFAADLPGWVFKRKKMGFAVPIGEWFRGPLRDLLRDHLFAADSFAASHFQRPAVERLIDEHDQRKSDHSQRLYALLMLELWQRNTIA
jgi:asparagine synthase (glutamine-hydrolysing)